jgi:predicted ester cyclase
VTDPRENEAIVRRLFDAVFNERALDVCDEIVAVDYVEHAVAPFGTDEPGAVEGPTHMRGVVDWLVGQYPDLRMRVDAVAAQGDMVATLVWSEGTNLGPFNGFAPPTGKRFAGRQSHWYRVAEAKLAEHWAVRDDLTTMIQLGVVQRPGPPA